MWRWLIAAGAASLLALGWLIGSSDHPGRTASNVLAIAVMLAALAVPWLDFPFGTRADARDAADANVPPDDERAVLLFNCLGWALSAGPPPTPEARVSSLERRTVGPLHHLPSDAGEARN